MKHLTYVCIAIVSLSLVGCETLDKKARRQAEFSETQARALRKDASEFFSTEKLAIATRQNILESRKQMDASIRKPSELHEVILREDAKDKAFYAKLSALATAVDKELPPTKAPAASDAAGSKANPIAGLSELEEKLNAMSHAIDTQVRNEEILEVLSALKKSDDSAAKPPAAAASATK